MKRTTFILDTKTEFLKYLKSRFPLFHLSNVFFRDVHYGIMSYLVEHGMRTSYPQAEEVARAVTAALEKDGVLKRINSQTWLLMYSEFALPRIQKSA